MYRHPDASKLAGTKHRRNDRDTMRDVTQNLKGHNSTGDLDSSLWRGSRKLFIKML